MSTAPAIYLDHAASTPLRDSVRRYLQEALDGPYANPSSTHQFGRKARSRIEDARKRMAQRLGCQPAELIFTSGGTESDNAALSLPLRDLGIRRIITAPTEHHAVLHPAEALQQHHGADLKLLRVDAQGRPDLNQLEKLLQEGPPSLVSLMHGNNEIGNLLDLQAVGELVHRHGGLLHSDTVQTVGHYPLDLGALPVDLASASAHKFYGPKGVGFLYLRQGLALGSHISGGAQQRGHRGGTENTLLIGAMALALDEALDHLAAERAHISHCKKMLQEGLAQRFPQVRFNGLSGTEESLYGVLSASFPAASGDPALLLFQLDLQGLAVSGGSACASGSHKGSHVLEALRPEDPPHPVLRFSPGKDTSEAEIRRALDIVAQVLSPQ